MKKTFRELKEIDDIIATIYFKNPKLKETKFGYAYKRFYEKNVVPTLRNLQEQIQDVNVEHALEDKDTKAVLVDATNSRGYKYSKEGLKKCLQEERKVLEKAQQIMIDVVPYICSQVPKELEAEDIELLTGLLI